MTVFSGDVNHFVFKEELYRSETIRVQRIQDPDTGKTYVLKRLCADFPDQRQVERLTWESDILDLVDDPGVIRSLGMHRHGNSMGLLLEDIQGTSLASSLSFLSPLMTQDPGVFLDGALMLAGALGAIHQKGVIHRKICPDTIIANFETRRYQIINFTDSSRLAMEEPGSISSDYDASMLPYMSPEQTGRVGHPLDYRTDFYSLGMVFYQLITGNLPFEAETLGDWVYSHIARQPVPPAEVNPRIPKPLSDCIMKLISKNPGDRYQSAAGLMHDMTLFLENWRCSRDIVSFPLGKRDIPERFSVSTRLVGRDKEMKQLLASIEATLEGRRGLHLLSGHSGVGKSSLIRELHASITGRHGNFVQGKFDPFSSNVPYQAFIQAFGELARLLLTLNDDRFNAFRAKLVDALGPNGRLVTDLIPEMTWVVGEQPPIEELNPIESKNRFAVTLGNCVKAFICKNTPLVIVLDDLQWADSASLELIELLVRSRRMHHFLIIGTYRSNEVDETHPLTSMVASLEGDARVDTTHVGPLEEKDVNLVVAHTLFRQPEECAALSRAVCLKSAGNPFYVGELLRLLRQRDFIFRDHALGAWAWDLEKIEKADITETIAEFMVEQLNRLPSGTREMLMTASVMGNRFSLQLTADICGTDPREAAGRLSHAVEKGLICPVGNYTALVFSGNDPGDDITYKFLHDRIRQSAEGLIPVHELPAVHLKVGRAMSRRFTPEDSQEFLLSMVGHLNCGRALIHDSAEQLELALLNLEAGKKAKRSIAHKSAFDHVKTAATLLGDDTWAVSHDLAFRVCLAYADMAFLCGERDESRTMFCLLHDKAVHHLEKAELLSLQTVHAMADSRYDDAVDTGIRALALLGIKLSQQPGYWKLFTAYLAVKKQLRNRSVSDLVDLPMVQDEKLELMSGTIREVLYAANSKGDINLCLLLPLVALTFILRNGNFPGASVCYAAYGGFLVNLKRFSEGYEFGRLALALNEKTGSVKYRARTLHLFTHYIAYWNMTPNAVVSFYREVIKAGYESGDYMFIAWASIPVDYLDPELDGPEVVERMTRRLADVKPFNFRSAESSIRIRLHFTMALCGMTLGRQSMSTEAVLEDEILEQARGIDYVPGVCFFHLKKTMLCFLFNDPGSAWHYLDETDVNRETVRGYYALHEYHIVSFLVVAGRYPEVSGYEKFRLGRRLKRHYRVIRAWADHCPDGFLHHRYLMEAELARIERLWDKAGELYDRAIDAALKHRYLFQEALINEVAARCFLGCGIGERAMTYLKKARFLFQQWGADEKVRHLDELLQQYSLGAQLE